MIKKLINWSLEHDVMFKFLIVQLIVALLAFGYYAFNHKPTENIPVENNSRQDIATDIVLDAVARAHQGAKKICFNEWFFKSNIKTAQFYLYYPILLSGEKDPEGQEYFHGWYYFEVKEHEFYESNNNTRFITDYPNDRYVKIYPKTEGLLCKEQT
jgi:hypothetical protein